jgi:hypothetical protein
MCRRGTNARTLSLPFPRVHSPTDLTEQTLKRNRNEPTLTRIATHPPLPLPAAHSLLLVSLRPAPALLSRHFSFPSSAFVTLVKLQVGSSSANRAELYSRRASVCVLTLFSVSPAVRAPQSDQFGAIGRPVDASHREAFSTSCTSCLFLAPTHLRFPVPLCRSSDTRGRSPFLAAFSARAPVCQTRRTTKCRPHTTTRLSG